jgi:hypothetical protein
VIVLGALAVGYVLARPSLGGVVPHLAILEFPVGMAVVAALLALALWPDGKRAPPPAPWRRHEQVVRRLPDPAAAPLVAAVERYLETGEGAEEAADVLAAGMGHDLSQRAGHRQRILAMLSSKGSRRRRESTLNEVLDPGA